MPIKGQMSHGKKTLALKQKCSCVLCEECREKIRIQKRASYHRCTKRNRIDYHKEYYRENKEYFQQYYQKYYQNNKEYFDARKRQRRAVQLRALGKWNITEDEHVKVLHRGQKGCCFYCDVKYGSMFHREHKTPLSRGGLHTPENIVLSCATCNLRKGTKTEEEYREILDIKTSA